MPSSSFWLLVVNILALVGQIDYVDYFYPHHLNLSSSFFSNPQQCPSSSPILLNLLSSLVTKVNGLSLSNSSSIWLYFQISPHDINMLQNLSQSVQQDGDDDQIASYFGFFLSQLFQTAHASSFSQSTQLASLHESYDLYTWLLTHSLSVFPFILSIVFNCIMLYKLLSKRTHSYTKLNGQVKRDYDSVDSVDCDDADNNANDICDETSLRNSTSYDTMSVRSYSSTTTAATSHLFDSIRLSRYGLGHACMFTPAPLPPIIREPGDLYLSYDYEDFLEENEEID